MKAHQIATFLCNKNRPRLETALEIAGAKCYVSEAWVKVRGGLSFVFFVLDVFDFVLGRGCMEQRCCLFFLA